MVRGCKIEALRGAYQIFISSTVLPHKAPATFLMDILEAYIGYHGATDRVGPALKRLIWSRQWH